MRVYMRLDLIETPAIYMNLSAFDNLKTRALLYDISDERINEVLNLIRLSNSERKSRSFSLGTLALLI